MIKYIHMIAYYLYWALLVKFWNGRVGYTWHHSSLLLFYINRY